MRAGKMGRPFKSTGVSVGSVPVFRVRYNGNQYLPRHKVVYLCGILGPEGFYDAETVLRQADLCVINPSYLPWPQLMPNTVRMLTMDMAKAADVVLVMPGARDDAACIEEILQARRDGKLIVDYEDIVLIQEG